MRDLTTTDLAFALGVSTCTLSTLRKIHAASFPTPSKHGHALFWNIDAVRGWLNSLPAQQRPTSIADYHRRVKEIILRKPF
ncbi:hypothetical protein [Methylosinus sp. R-45379]|uniref:hypothetical protein n=1 Tax=Methylosinus sp. R-45379 TaxID=980563 RepID=UPI0012EDE408|nr:hypothetical protein [Methylosinus sp. R-45379]